MSVELIASIDQGTQSTRLTVFDLSLNAVGSVEKSHRQLYPQAGWVEHDPLDIMKNIYDLFVLITDQLNAKFVLPTDYIVKCVGVTNQRETIVAWDKVTGIPLYNAIVWLDTRTKSVVDDIISNVGGVDALRAQSGLPVNTYFSGSKIRWMMDNVPSIPAAVDADRCYFGTMDSWIIWNLTGGAEGGQFVTDITNASRTQLMDLVTCQWSKKLLSVFKVSESCLPEIRSCSELYGCIVKCGCPTFENVPISGCAGDQQAACIGHGIFQQYQVKCTYGTGAFTFVNTGNTPVFSTAGLLTTPCFQLGPSAPVYYALEGSIAIAGAAITWLRDNLGIIESSNDTEALIKSVDNSGGTYFVPAFSGLFAPRWRQDARGCVVGITQHTKKAHIVRALMESLGFQLQEIVQAMLSDMHVDRIAVVRVDGGMSKNDAFLQMTADLCGCTVERPAYTEVTSIGAAIAAGFGCGIWISIHDVEKVLCSSTRRWNVNMPQEERDRKIKNWNKAVERSLGWV